ncbi:MAG: hypothetical protein JXR76_29285 [Deltaproteobacteria bacterium]|nr:hypothetical protein [Deltaproteobacteria bacterium]
MNENSFLNKRQIIFSVSTTVTLLAIFPVVFNQLTWDDIYIIDNNPLLGKWTTLSEILTRPFWENSSFVEEPLMNYWRPMTSFILWGVSLIHQAPWMFHGVSLLAAILASITIYFFAKTFLSPPEITHFAKWAGLLYLSHPLTAEVTCMAANISDHLALIFFWSAFYHILKYIKNPGGIRLFIISTLVFLSCSSKEFGLIAAIIPTGFALLRKLPQHLDWVKLTAKQKTELWCSCIVPAIAFLILRHFVLASSDAVISKSMDATFLTSIFFGIGLAIEKIVCFAPSGTTAGAMEAHVLHILLSSVAILTTIVTIVIAHKKSSKFAQIVFGLCAAHLLLIPSLFAVLPSDKFVEIPVRYFHLALPGYLIALTPIVSRRLSSSKLFYLLPLITATLASNAYIRISQWKDSISLFSSEVAASPDSPDRTINLAEALIGIHAFTDAEKLLNDFEKKYQAQRRLMEADISSIRSEISFGRDGDLQTAHMLAQKSISINPNKIKFIERFAIILAAEGRRDDAAILLKSAVGNRQFSTQQKKYLLNLRNEIMQIDASKNVGEK